MVTIASHGPKTVERFQVEPWALHFYRYHGSIRISNETYPIVPGSVGITPPGLVSEYRFPERCTHGCFHFYARGEQLVDLAPILPLGEAFAAAWAQFEEALGLNALSQLRAEIKLWDLLWQHAERSQLPTRGVEPLHPVVAQAARYIETHLDEPVAIGEIAERLDISHNHLTRLFQRHLGQTPISYLIERRLQRAERLLRHSNMPVKQIAAQVGVPDLQAFNKTFRSKFGVSPREYRWNPPASST